MTTPLYDQAAEEALLGAIVIRNDALDDVADLVSPEDFGRDHHQRIFSAMQALGRTGQVIDAVTLSAQLARQGDLEEVGRPAIYALGNGVPRSANAQAYAAAIRDKALLRRVRAQAQQLLAAADAEDADAVSLLEQAEQAIFSLRTAHTPGDWVSADSLAMDLTPMIQQLAQTREGVTGLATGFLDLDRLTRGLQPGNLVLVGARPAVGKTAFALQMALHAAKRTPVAFFSLEMDPTALGLRAVSALASLDGWRLLSGRLSDRDYTLAGEGVSRLGLSQMWFDDSPYLSPVQARSKLRRLKAKHGLGLVVIDYLQLMAPLPEHRKENRTTQVSGISRALKLMAREFQVPFLVLAQLNRGLERAAEKRPQLSDLRESGALEQDADVVCLLHRPELYEPERPELKGIAEVILAKQRNGPVGAVKLLWQAQFTRFETYLPGDDRMVRGISA